MSTSIDPILLAQRIRNGIIEDLELYASYEKQNNYQRAVPFVHVPAEAIELWVDWDPDFEAQLAGPAYSPEEVEALRRFDAVWEEVFDSTPNPLPALAVLQQSAPWLQLREAAAECLAIMNKRGRLPEDALADAGPSVAPSRP